MNPEFFIFGDSHAGTLMRAAKAMGIDFAGGSILAGMYLNDYFCTVEDGQFKMLTETGETRLALRLRRDGLSDNLLDADLPILSTVGFNTNNFAAIFQREGLAILGSEGEHFITQACFEAVVLSARRGALDFYRRLKQAGKTVFATRSPQRFTEDQIVVAGAFEEVIARALAKIGVPIVDVRAQTTDNRGLLLSQFANTEGRDRVHGNDAYGRIVIERFHRALAAQAA